MCTDCNSRKTNWKDENVILIRRNRVLNSSALRGFREKQQTAIVFVFAQKLLILDVSESYKYKFFFFSTTFSLLCLKSTHESVYATLFNKRSEWNGLALA